MPLEPDELKRITDLGAELASLRVDLDKMRSTGAPEAEIKKFGTEIEGLKAAIAKLTPTASGAVAPAPVGILEALGSWLPK